MSADNYHLYIKCIRYLARSGRSVDVAHDFRSQSGRVSAWRVRCLLFLSDTNLALHMPARQSGMNGAHGANLAVDGQTSSASNDAFCAIVNISDPNYHQAPTDTPNAFWQVDLGAVCVITSVVLVNTKDQAGEALINTQSK